MKVLTDTNQLTKQAFIGMPPVSNADSASQNKTGNQTENKIGNQIRNQTKNQINEKSRQPYISVRARRVFSCPTWHAFKT